METDAVFFARRAMEERLAATTATHELARQSHLEMAERYEDLTTATIEREPSLGLHLVRDRISDPVNA